jgi:cellulose synthase/poly-beta-1,6-N-acetylglucosamine synthase-like glycosyltransferase
MTTNPHHPDRTHRLLEILPGFVSWFLILFPVWGSLVIPNLVAYYIITFDVYWLYRSASMAVLAVLSEAKINASKNYDWMKDVVGFGDWEQVHHIIIIPTYQEPVYILRRTLVALTKQTFPPKKLSVFLAFEEREGHHAQEKSLELIKEFRSHFANLVTTFHPDIEGETKGKSSNTAYAAKAAKKLVVDQQHHNIDYVTITSEDADARFHEEYFACVTFKFLDNPQRYNRIWQPGILYYNNIWKAPLPIRVFSSMSSIVQISLLNRTDRLINFSTYTTSLKMVHQIGYWDVDVIPEDYRLFFKAYFALSGRLEVQPVFLPVFADAAVSSTYIKSLANQYKQAQRWAWGVSDDAYIIKKWFAAKDIPFWDKTLRVLKVIEDHFLWPVNWFAVTLGATLPPLLNDNFARTIIGKRLPQTSSLILTIAVLSMLVMIAVDFKQRPDKHQQTFLRKLLAPLEFILLPVVGFFFSALPGLDAHTRLMLGKYIEYKVTEKV